MALSICEAAHLNVCPFKNECDHGKFHEKTDKCEGSHCDRFGTYVECLCTFSILYNAKEQKIKRPQHEVAILEGLANIVTEIAIEESASIMNINDIIRALNVLLRKECGINQWPLEEYAKGDTGHEYE